MATVSPFRGEYPFPTEMSRYDTPDGKSTGAPALAKMRFLLKAFALFGRTDVPISAVARARTCRRETCREEELACVEMGGVTEHA